MTISSISSITPTTFTPSTTAATSTADSSAPSTQLSTMGQLMSQLQSLEQSDPDKAKTVLAKIGSDLQSTNPDLATKFTQASQTGDLSALQPKGHGGHHHHHGGGGAKSYAQSSDPMAQIESVISSALQDS